MRQGTPPPGRPTPPPIVPCAGRKPSRGSIARRCGGLGAGRYEVYSARRDNGSRYARRFTRETHILRNITFIPLIYRHMLSYAFRPYPKHGYYGARKVLFPLRIEYPYIIHLYYELYNRAIISMAT